MNRERIMDAAAQKLADAMDRGAADAARRIDNRLLELLLTTSTLRQAQIYIIVIDSINEALK